MYIQLSNTKLYYECFGTGKPIIMLHGNGEDSSIFDKTAKKLAVNHMVYLLDSRNHGKSEKHPKNHYADMADDVVEFINDLGIDKPILYGFSDGGIIGVLIAVGNGNILSKLIVSGVNLKPSGMKFGTVLGIIFEYLFKRDVNTLMMLKEPHIKAQDLKNISVPTVVIAGEHDVIRKRHTYMIAKNIPNSELVIVKGENHGSYIVHSDKLYDILIRYI